MKELLVNKLLREQLLRIFGLPIDRRDYLGLNIYSFCIHTSKIAHFNRLIGKAMDRYYKLVVVKLLHY